MIFDFSVEVADMLHVRTKGLRAGDPVAEPLNPSSTFVLGDNPSASQIYGRYGAANTQSAEERLSKIENAPSILFSSGMATYAALILAAVEPGDKVLVLEDGYFHARLLLERVFASYRVEMLTFSATEAESVALDEIKLVIIESPTNPNLDVIDVKKFCSRANSAGCLVAVDNTFCTGLLQRPLDLGADVVLASDTKAPGGHSDLILGHLSTRNTELFERAKEVRMFAGSIPGAYEAFLLSRSLETLELRLARMCDTAEVIAQLLCASPAVNKVRYPGLRSDPAFAVSTAQMNRYGFVLGATFRSLKCAEEFIDESGFIVRATSFGGTHTSADRRARWGDPVDEGFLRVSAGVEPTEIVHCRLAAALKEIEKKVEI